MTLIKFLNIRLAICSLAVTMWNWSLSNLGVYILLGIFNLILCDPVWHAGSGLAILKNFPISNCGRCLTKAWTRRMKKKRRMMMQMTKMKMITMSWMTWLWCLTEAGGNIQDNWLCRSSHNAIEMCCYSMTVQKMVPFVSKHIGAHWSPRAADSFYIHCLLHKQICMMVPESSTFYPVRNRKSFPLGIVDF